MNERWRHTIGYIMIMLSSCFWGGSASFGKTLMHGGISTIRLMEIRSVLTSSFLILFLTVFSRKQLKIAIADLPILVLLAIPGLALVNASYYKAVDLMPVAVAAFIQFTAPVLIFLYGYFRGTESATFRKFVALLLSLAGVYLMLRIDPGTSTKWPMFGVLCAVISMFSYSFYVLVSHGLTRKYSPWTLVAYGYGIASLFWCVIANPVETVKILNQHSLWMAAALFALVSTLIPFMLFLSGLKRVSATGAAIASTAETVTAALFAYLFLKEALKPVQIAGAVMIFAAILMLILQPQRTVAVPSETDEHPEIRA